VQLQPVPELLEVEGLGLSIGSPERHSGRAVCQNRPERATPAMPGDTIGVTLTGRIP
jgi:hypothetical protein